MKTFLFTLAFTKYKHKVAVYVSGKNSLLPDKSLIEAFKKGVLQ
jgi:hypothetical protein